jgi:peptidoglycan hydrolase-like protein with peptidoglycan-binding domain
MRRLTVLIVGAALAIPAAAAAASPAAAPATAAAPRAATPASAGLTLAARHVNGSVGAIVSDWDWTVHGAIAPYVPGQRITLHVFRNGKRIITTTLAIHRDGDRGTFASSLRIGGVGRISVRAIHYATPAQGLLVSHTYSIWLVAPAAQPGESTYAVRILQHDLSALHYVVGAPGVYDAQTQQAVVAFRKLANLVRNDVVDDTVFQAIAAGAGVFTVRYPSQGRHVEADLTHQVLALIGANGAVQRIYQISSGKPSTPTQLGTYSVYWKEWGTNSDGMVDSNFFNGGDAIHGYAEVPTYAASHGCLRVWIPDAAAIYGWVAVGTPVDVYYRGLPL